MTDIKQVIAIYGNPGAGKSTLANCHAKKQVFASGLSAGGLTKKLQEYYVASERTLWTDTPGLADPLMRAQAAAEIEACLKKDKDYKIAFVVTVDSGRVRAQDIETVNCVCNAIKTDFTYGLIINKVSPNVKAFLEQKDNLSMAVSLMNKRPVVTTIIPNVAMAADENNVLITDTEVQRLLSEFFNGLRPSFIRQSEVNKIDVQSFDDKVKEITRLFNEKLKQSITAYAREEKVEESPEQFFCNVDEKKRAGGLKGSKIWTLAVYGKIKTTYSRDKITRGSGEVEYTPWKIVGEPVKTETKRVHIATDGDPR